MSIVAGPLSDNRLQLFVNYGDAIWTTWQQSADPDSGWFPWSPMEATQGVECVATCSLADGSLALFVIGVQGALYGQKLSSDVDADWGYFFSVFETGYGLSIAALVLPWSAPQVAAFVLANDPQITYQGPGQLYQTLKGGSDVSDSFGPATYFVNPGPWFFGRVTLPISPAAGLILAARLPNDQIQLCFNAPMANTADSPIFSTWGGADNSEWPGWEPFQQVPDNNNAWQLAVGQLPDRRLQMWAFSNTAPTLYSCWKETPDADAPWTPWTSFEGTFEPGVLSLAVAPLSDGRLQLWALDNNNAISSTWKLTTDPNSGWEPWSAFAALP